MPWSPLIWTHPGHRWVLHIPDPPGASPDLAATVRDVLGLPGLPVDVLGSGQWTAAAQTAARYAYGPVFLAGDAAHRVPPTGATGVSAAMHDAHNLAWKVAAVLGGRAGQALLQSRHAANRSGTSPLGRHGKLSTAVAADQRKPPAAPPDGIARPEPGPHYTNWSIPIL